MHTAAIARIASKKVVVFCVMQSPFIGLVFRIS